MFRGLIVHFHEPFELEIKAANLCSAFIHESGHDAVNFRGVSIDHLVFVANDMKHNIFI